MGIVFVVVVFFLIFEYYKCNWNRNLEIEKNISTKTGGVKG